MPSLEPSPVCVFVRSPARLPGVRHLSSAGLTTLGLVGRASWPGICCSAEPPEHCCDLLQLRGGQLSGEEFVVHTVLAIGFVILVFSVWEFARGSARNRVGRPGVGTSSQA